MKRSLAPSQRNAGASKGALLIPKFTPIQRAPQNTHLKQDSASQLLPEADFSSGREIVNETNSCNPCNQARKIQPKPFSVPRTPLRALNDAKSEQENEHSKGAGDLEQAEGPPADKQSGDWTLAQSPSLSSPSPLSTPSTVRRQPFELKRSGLSLSAPSKIQQAAPTKQEREEIEPVYWEVFWTKASKKKHKTFSDGVLIVKGKSAQLIKEDGEMASKTTVRCSGSLHPEKTIFIGSFECELVKCITEDEYIAKGADMAATQAQAHAFVQPKVNLLTAASKKSNFPASSHVRVSIPAMEKAFASSENETKPTKNFVIDPSRNGAYVLTDPGAPIVVATDPVLGLHLKPHQVAGVKFLYESVMRKENVAAINGCILADEMGLGKTLQAIALMWTLLKQSPTSLSVPSAKKAVVVCPSSLVSNWANEMKKWLGDQRAPTQSVMGGQGAKEAVQDFVLGSIKRVLIISYDMLRRHIQALSKCSDVGLLVCDEGQRLKNIEGNKTIDALNAIPCSRRILLSGTPIQNDLDEFYAMFSWVCPGLLGNPRQFRLIFADSIVKSRDKGSSSDAQRVGRKRLKELNKRTSGYILRRTARSVADSLPVKYENLVFCRPCALQRNIYKALLGTAQARKAIEGGNGTVVLSLISKLAKVLNHPDLVREQGGQPDQEDEGTLSIDRSLFPPDYAPLDPAQSGKMLMVLELLSQIRGNTQDRVVVVSNYTTTLDVLEKLCAAAKFPCLRLDGGTEVSKRAGIVQTFNNTQNDSFVFLLSSKAGGCGLNLIGSNRMILVDPSWNPAHDAQAMGRVWRFGQLKTCFIYRMLTTGTMEERILQKQIRKGELETLVVDDGEDATCRHFDKSEIKNIFILRHDTECDTYDLLSKSPEFEHTERQGVPVVASYACHRDMLEVPSLKEEDPALCYALAKHPQVVTFLMTKRQSPEDAKLQAGDKKRDCMEGDSDSDSDFATAAVVSKESSSRGFDLDVDSDDDFEVDKANEAHRSLGKGRPSTAEDKDDRQVADCAAGSDIPRKRRRLLPNDSESDS